VCRGNMEILVFHSLAVNDPDIHHTAVIPAKYRVEEIESGMVVLSEVGIKFEGRDRLAPAREMKFSSRGGQAQSVGR
jgi:hypothetical protein